MHILKSFRLKNKLSRAKFSKMCGLAPITIQFIEEGRIGVSPKTALKIEETTAGEIKAEWLLLPEKYKHEIEKYVKEAIQ